MANKKFRDKSTIDPRKGKKDPLADYKAEERRKKKIKEMGSFSLGAAVMGTRAVIKNKDKIKKKISDIGNMKVKDAASKIGSAVGALSPIAVGKRIGQGIVGKGQQPGREQSPRRITPEQLKRIREKLKRGKIRLTPMPGATAKPLGKMKKQGPKPGTMDYFLQETMKPGYKVPRMLTGGQAKIAKKAPPFNKINEKDFAVLREEKAKGRGQGLQDEKMKPGKIMKADKGGMGEATGYKKYLKGLKNIKDKTDLKKSKFIQRRMTLAGREALKAAKATKIGKIAAGVAGAALLAKAGLEKMYEKRTGKKPFTKRPEKKMGGGMMQRPMMAMGGGMMPGYKKGKSVMAKGCKLGRKKPTKMYT